MGNKKWPFRKNEKLVSTKNSTPKEPIRINGAIPMPFPLNSVDQIPSHIQEAPTPKAPPLKIKKKLLLKDMDWINDLQIGDIVDVADDQEKWYESVIRYIEMKGDRKLLYLHYIGWNKKWDEPIFADDLKRIAKRNSMTKGPYRNDGLEDRFGHVHLVYPSHYSRCYSDCWTPK